MGKISWHSQSISELELDLPLRYDVFSESGDRIANAGDLVSPSTKNSWLQLGLDKIYFRLVDDILDADLLRFHDQAVIKNIENNVEITIAVIRQLALEQNSKPAVSDKEFDHLCRDFLTSIEQDSAAALQVLANSLFKCSNDSASEIAERNVQLSLLSMAIAQEMGLLPAECRIVGKIAMLHDISLMGMSDKDAQSQEHYRQHPILSAQVCESLTGLDPKVAVGVSQVHEDTRGTGFPQGIHGSKLLRSDRIVNSADAFLTLTKNHQPDMMPHVSNFHPADAIGYLMYQVKQGQFQADVIRAMVSAMSLYPIGSSVILSDQSQATVLRSTQSNGSKPIICRADGKPVDLRYSAVSISGPNRTNYATLQRSQLDLQLWI